MEDQQSIHDTVVVMVPFPGQSHLNQLLELAALIAAHALPVHFIGSSTHNRQVKLRAIGLKPEAIARVIFHDFPTPPIETPDPSTGTDKTPMHLLPAVFAYTDFCEPVAALVQQLSSEARRVVVVFDICNTSGIKDVVAIPNVECYAFHTSPALYYFFMLWNAYGKPFSVDGEINGFPSIKELSMEMSTEFLVKDYEVCKERAGDIFNTTRSLEGPYIDLLGREEINGKKKKKQWAIRSNLQKKLNTSMVHESLVWLDKQATRSVVYVCFGSTFSFSVEEAREIAMGLEQSKHKFIWVLLPANKADIFSGETARIELPEGFEERVVAENLGMVVREWAPQLEILAHKSVGGLMCHGGWNSCFESLAMGVPIAAWPMHSDQPFVAQFLTKVLKVGMIVREWAEREELVKASRIRSAVERLIASEEGDQMRKRAEEICAAINKNWVEECSGGGECCDDLESFIVHIIR